MAEATEGDVATLRLRVDELEIENRELRERCLNLEAQARKGTATNAPTSEKCRRRHSGTIQINLTPDDFTPTTAAAKGKSNRLVSKRVTRGS
jgi:hypothetical protein